LDLQGPLSGKVIQDVLQINVSALKYFQFQSVSLWGHSCIVSHTGYTGELGYELYVPRESSIAIWQKLLSDHRVKPAGLGARDTLRTEMGYSLYGHELSDSISPIEADLEKFVNFSKDFLGKSQLEQQKAQGVTRIKVAFQASSRRSPRTGYQIYCYEEEVGIVTSGVFSPMLECGIGMGFVHPKASKIGQELLIRSKDIEIPVTVVNLPFYHK